MLIICTECKQVVEVETLREHLLDECEHRRSYRPCPKCGDALHNREYNTHVGSCNSAPVCTRLWCRDAVMRLVVVAVVVMRLVVVVVVVRVPFVSLRCSCS